jgi:hypothetical protein
MNAGYGQALYYPYIHLGDEHWLKVAALYYESLARIVPYGYPTADSAFVKALDAKTAFIKNITPRQEIMEIQDGFLAFAREHLASPEARETVWSKLDGQLPPVIAVLHRNKFEAAVLGELIELGLASEPNDWDAEWYPLDPLTAVLYMTFLANRVAERRGLPVVTDDPTLQPLLRAFQSDSSRDSDAAYALASLVIETEIPVNLDQISVNQIVEFRESSELERLRFYEALRGVSKDLTLVEDAKALKDLLEHKQKLIRDAISGLELCYLNTGIACVTGLLGLSIPAWSIALGKMPNLSSIPIVTVATVAVGMAAQRVIDIEKARRDSPWAYVLTLRRGLAKENFLKQLQQGNILI